MSVLFAFILTALLFAGAIALFIRFGAMVPGRWHLDPQTALRSGRPNDWLVTPHGAVVTGEATAGIYDLPMESLCGLLVEAALAEPRSQILAGDTMLGFVTLVQRSAWMGYPDAVTIMTLPVSLSEKAPTSTLTIFSRARYGHSDFGTNRARVERLLASVAPFLAPP